MIFYQYNVFTRDGEADSDCEDNSFIQCRLCFKCAAWKFTAV